MKIALLLFLCFSLFAQKEDEVIDYYLYCLSQSLTWEIQRGDLIISGKHCADEEKNDILYVLLTSQTHDTVLVFAQVGERYYAQIFLGDKQFLLEVKNSASFKNLYQIYLQTKIKQPKTNQLDFYKTINH